MTGRRPQPGAGQADIVGRGSQRQYRALDGYGVGAPKHSMSSWMLSAGSLPPRQRCNSFPEVPDILASKAVDTGMTLNQGLEDTHSTAPPSGFVVPNNPGKQPRGSPLDARSSLQGSSWASLSRASMSGKESSLQQQLYRSSKDDYLLNLFRKEDTGYVPLALPALVGQAGQLQQGAPGTVQSAQQLSAFPAVQLPGFPGYGMLPQNARPAQAPHAAARAPGLLPEQLKRTIGGKAYAQLRSMVVQHQEMFGDQVFELHRLTQRQRHMEANCEDSARYRGELQRLATERHRLAGARAAAQQEGTAEGAAEGEELLDAQDTQDHGDTGDERKGSNTLTAADLAGAEEGTEGSKAPADQLLEQIGSVGMIGTTPAAALQQQHQTLAVVQRQRSMAAAAAAHGGVVDHHSQHLQHQLSEAQRQQSMQNMAAVAAVHGGGAADHQSPHMQQQLSDQHQQNMAELAQAHALHQQDMVASAQAHRQHQLNMAERAGLEQGAAAGIEMAFQRGGGGMAAAQPGLPKAGSSTGANVGPDGATGIFPGAFQNMGAMGMNSGMGAFAGYGQQMYPGFGGYYSGMGGFPFVNPYGMMGGASGGFDPLACWYSHHYGRGVAQAQAQAAAYAGQATAAGMANAAAADGAAAAANGAAAADLASPAAAVEDAQAGQGTAGVMSGEAAPQAAAPVAARWWQDPAQAFGPEILPEVVARRSSPQRVTSNSSKRYKAASRPGLSRPEREDQDWEPAGMLAHPKQRAKRAEAANRGTPPDAQQRSKRSRLDEATGQTSGGGATRDGGTFGCGSSAFRKIPQRPRNNRAIARADSIGSENSKSSFAGNAAANQAGTHGRTPPRQLQSAANILVGLHGHNPNGSSHQGSRHAPMP